MFRRVLIANRGEVAARVLRTCRDLDISCVAVTTTADLGASWHAQADEVVCIGGPRAYMDADAILEAAALSRASAIHPGWGFLAENAQFAHRCEAAGFAFLGPSGSLIRRMGDKIEARKTMESLGVPVIPGTGVLLGLEEARKSADALGFPVLVKASAGGGGRGMRVAAKPEDLEQAWHQARAEAESTFGDGRLYLEKFIVGGRHVEFQVVGDGSLVKCLGDRECSVQRRHQKLLEECPSPALNEETRREMSLRIERALSALGYRSVGTVEMLSSEGSLYFMEMNTRLQVEHPVTELVWGVDLVAQQLKLGANQALDLDCGPRGHAMELRINAESPLDFRPSPGTLTRFDLPAGEGIRVDTHLCVGDEISPHYDSLICKIISWGETREVCMDRLAAALDDTCIEGVESTCSLHRALLSSAALRSGEYDTSTVETLLASGSKEH